jgi:hypothetical protein
MLNVLLINDECCLPQRFQYMMNVGVCGILNAKTQACAWMPTRSPLQNPEHRTQDGLVHVEVFTECALLLLLQD